MMSLPVSVRVGCFDFSVEDMTGTQSMSRNRWGECCFVELVLRVNRSGHPMHVLDTLLHEIGHAIYWAYHLSDEDQEERVVATFATAWTQVYRDNPKLLEWISNVSHHTKSPPGKEPRYV